jgi:hypothetical protein
MLAGKEFTTNEEVIAETEVYFEAISKICMTAIIVVSPSKGTILKSNFTKKMRFNMLAYELSIVLLIFFGLVVNSTIMFYPNHTTVALIFELRTIYMNPSKGVGTTS